MMSSKSSFTYCGSFRVVEHVVTGQHVRNYPGATASGYPDPLHLAAKQYIPIDNTEPGEGNITILAAHANGFPKELYEPFWEELQTRFKYEGLKIRSIWMADVAHQGQSGMINEKTIGNDPSWFDHSLDLLHLINEKRLEMPQPIIGIGHSMGGLQLAHLSLLHPRLIHSLILIDPIILRQATQLEDDQLFTVNKMLTEMTRLSLYRSDKWPSREKASESFRNSPFYHSWDSRVLEKWVEYGLRDLPTAIYPDESRSDVGPPSVTLTTTRHQEVYTFTRPTFGNWEQVDSAVTHPDIEPSTRKSVPFYRAEPSQVFTQLPLLRPSVLYIYGSKSGLAHPTLRKGKLSNTGIGLGGSGGAVKGFVQEVCMDEVGHLIPMEKPELCAEVATNWIRSQVRRWELQDRVLRAALTSNGPLANATASDQWKRVLQQKHRQKTPASKF